MSRSLNLLRKSVIILAGITLLSSGTAALAQAGPTTVNGITTQTASASDAFPGLRGFLNMPQAERSQINVYYVLRVKHVDPATVHISLTSEGKTIPLTLQSDGRISPLPTRDQLNGGATVSISGPESASVAMKLHVYSTQPLARTYDAVGLAKGVKQGNAAMVKIAGALALMLPKLDRVYFVGGGDAVCELSNGQKVPLPRTTQKGEYPIGTSYFVPSEISGALKINLSAQPSQVHFDNTPK